MRTASAAFTVKKGKHEMKIELAFDDDDAPPLPVGVITRLDPILSERDGETVIAFRLIDLSNGAVLATLSMDQVTIDGRLASRTRVRVAK
jgi:hypothetical protein